MEKWNSPQPLFHFSKTKKSKNKLMKKPEQQKTKKDNFFKNTL